MSSSPALPPDRGHVLTEQRHPDSMALDAMDTRAIVGLIVGDHVAVLDALRDAADDLAAFIDGLAQRMARGGRLIYLGAGTSGRLGVLDASECPPTFQSDPSQVVGIIAGGDAALRRSSEGREDEPDGAREVLQALSLNADDTLLGIAAGGTTPYVLGGLAIGKSMGAATALLTCAPPHMPPRDCDQVIVLHTGSEALTGSTRLKAGSATKIALNIITTAAFVRLGKTFGNLMVDLRATNQKLADRAIRILVELCPELSREQAAEALQRAGGQLKIAIVMQRLDVGCDEAARLLSERHGRLREIIEPQ